MKNSWGSLTDRVKRDRIRVATAAWAYENRNASIMSDSAYDELSAQVKDQVNIATGNHRLDRFFQRHFTQHSGLWIHKHPQPLLLENIYARYYYEPKRRKHRR